MNASKVRIYDLAKELKMESKRVIEEIRREGFDVSVPSNSVPKELAEKIRNKYFPKKEPTAPRAIRVVKKAARAVEEAAPVEAPPPAEAPVPEAYAEAVPETDAEVAPVQDGQTARPSTARLVKKLTPAPAPAPAARAERPDSDGGAATAPPLPAQQEEYATAAPEAPPAHVEQEEEQPITTTSTIQQEAPTVSAPLPGRQVRVLRPTTAALSAGVQPGQRAPVPVAPPQPVPARDPRGRDDRRRGGRGRRGETEEMRGTPGETATPQTTYIPTNDTRRPRSRRGGPQSHGRGPDGRGRGYERDYVPPPKALSAEQRLAASIGTGTNEAPKEVRLVEGATVKDFAEQLNIKPKEVLTVLVQRGVFATINQPLDVDVAKELGQRFGFDVSFVPFEEMVAEQEFEEMLEKDVDDVELPRAPVVTVMGHVDHGKTSLLDAIRSANVAAGEAGGITQHIGAYSVEVASPDAPEEKRRVVFIDTPGHEAFTLMRARGAKVTDVVVLVVAADDGVMPQTVEAIEHARAAGVPIVVAINKVDKPDANPDRVKQELAVQGLQPVDWGGDVEMVPVSAKLQQNLDTLLETILLTADILNLRASPTRLASGVVLEVKKHRGLGTVATVLVQQGTIRVGDPFIVGQVHGKVRNMFDDRGQPIKEAGPATPVEILGLQGEPMSGDHLQVVSDITRAQSISEHRQMQARQASLMQTTKRGIEALGQKEVKELVVVVKADVQGSVEVLRSTLQKLSTEQVQVRVIRTGVGPITESDVLLASATQAEASGRAVVVIGFNVRPETRAADLAKQEHVDVRLHSIIYKVEEEIRAAMIGMLEAIEKEVILGRADVREVFRVPRLGAIAGCMVVDGVIRRNSRARLIRDGVVAWEGGIASVRRFKEDVGEVRTGFECGIGLENFSDIKVGDQIESYVIEKVAATEL